MPSTRSTGITKRSAINVISLNPSGCDNIGPLNGHKILDYVIRKRCGGIPLKRSSKTQLQVSTWGLDMGRIGLIVGHQ
jgi:hypothetical protein